MSELLAKALSPQMVNLAWKRLRSDRAVWAPGLSRAEMEPNFAHHLLQLVDEVRAGRYRPHPLRQFAIAKGDGGQRVLSALCLRDKLAQRLVLNVLDPIGEALFHHDSFGYRPGRNVDMALARVRERVICGLEWLVDADIRSFFDRIPHKPLRKLLKEHIPDREILKLIDLWLAITTSHAGPFAGRRGISQGAIISPFLCNLYLHSLDQSLAQRDIPFVRFADDFVLFAKDERNAEKALAFVRTRIEALGLELHPDKTRMIRSNPKYKFLGKSLPRPCAPIGAGGKVPTWKNRAPALLSRR